MITELFLIVILALCILNLTLLYFQQKREDKQKLARDILEHNPLTVEGKILTWTPPEEEEVTLAKKLLSKIIK